MLRVKDWAIHFENNRTRDLVRMEWVPFTNRHDGDSFTDLMERPDGVLHFGAWVLIVQVASKCGLPAARCGVGAVPRGTLARESGKAHDARSLARLTGAPEAVFAAAIPVLLEIGWLEEIPGIPGDFAIPQEGAPPPQEGAGIPHDPAQGGSRAYAPADARAPVPFRSVPSVPEGGVGETKKPRATQADYDRALRVLAAYPDKAPKDGRPIAKTTDAQNVLAVRIAADPDYPFEEHARLERQNPTPKNAHAWALTVPDLVALDALRKTGAPVKREYFTA